MANVKKLIAMFLIFTLSFVHFATVTEAIATTDFVSIFTGANSNKNIEFEAYLSNGEEETDSLISSVNNEELAIKLKLNVKENGYLKHGKVEILAEDGQELNFKVKENNNVAENDDVQSLSENVLLFNKIDSSSDEIEVLIPIEYEMEEYINEAKINSTAKIILSGIYVDNEAEENEIFKEVDLTLGWKDEREVSVEEEVSKYVEFGDNGAILQTIVKVDNSNDIEKSLPTKELNVNIEVPRINNVLPSNVSVIANSTIGTNGKGIGEAELSDEDVIYNKEEGKISIKVKNEKKLVDIVSNDYLKVEDEEVKQEERYYSKAGMDEFIVTYTFRNVELSDEININSKVEATVTTFSGDVQDTVATAEKTNNFKLEGQTGNIISYTIENETKEVSKSYAYLGKEVEYDSKTAINVSYTDIVEKMIVADVENYYIDKDGNKVEADDIYYKQISVSKNNFNEILGEDGIIKILDNFGNEIATINNENSTDEDGNYVVNFQDKVSKIVIETSSPVSTGNLVVSNKKAVSNISIEKDAYSNCAAIVTKTVQKAGFEYVSDLVELNSYEVETKLNDVSTDFNLIIDRDSLSTVVTNTNVEMRLELNNDKETSDIYGDSIFEIEMPKNVKAINVTNASILNGEGLEISNVEAYTRDGQIVLRISISGEQKDFNSGVLTNGTNIVLNSDITVKNYTSSEDVKVKAYVLNSKATNYANTTEYTINNSAVGYQEAIVRYSAPSGLFAVNTTYNYNNEGSSTTSIKQGKKIDYIDIYSEAKTAVMDIVVINNNDEAVSNLAILGRVPFEGVKDIVTSEELGTTLDIKLLNGISSNEEFVVYYSENGEATKNLNDLSNAWVQNPESFENIKSYLIVPVNSDYKLEAKQILKFSYEYEIPENLNHNENIYGTFATYYTDEIGNEEVVVPDVIGLTTGAGPELTLDLSVNKEEIISNDELKITAIVKNTGKDLVQNVVTNISIPENTEFVSAEADRNTVSTEYIDGKVVASFENLSIDTEVNIIVTVKAIEMDEYEESTLSISATTTAKDLGTELTKTIENIIMRSSELYLTQEMDFDYPEQIFKKGDELNLILNASNLTEKDKSDAKVEVKLPNEINYEEAYILEENENGEVVRKNTVTRDGSKITFNLGNFAAESGKTMHLKATVGDIESGITEKKVAVVSTISAKDTNNYQAENLELNLGRSSLSVTQTTETPTYVTEGDYINYTFNIKNEGPSMENDVVLTDIVPDGVVVKEMAYTIGDSTNSVRMSQKDKAELSLTIPGNEEAVVNVIAIASTLKGTDEASVTNEAKISSPNVEEIKSNSVVHIIKAVETTVDESGKADTETNINTITNNNSNTNTNSNTNNYTSTDITKSYKISGIAWIDANKDGKRDDSEQRMSNVTAMLVDSASGVIKGTTATNANGEYTFTGIQNGSYLVLFKYDTTLYTTATYRKEGIESNINSDAVTTKIEQNGKKENGAVTDRIEVNGANVTNIDIGLVESAQFSLALDKSITKVTVQNSQGTVTEEFSNTKLAKYDIAAKYLAGTTVYVEYTFKVTNNGDLAGFATEIVDYIPQGMTFNSNLNSDWYTGTDGNLYTKALANIELATGESRDIKLVLTKQMTTENTGLVSNTAEISDDYNIYGVSDRNSKPANKAQGEDDMSTADTILTVKTGESLIYVSAIIVSILIGGACAFIVYERVLKNKRNGGV